MRSPSQTKSLLLKYQAHLVVVLTIIPNAAINLSVTYLLARELGQNSFSIYLSTLNFTVSLSYLARGLQLQGIHSYASASKNSSPRTKSKHGDWRIVLLATITWMVIAAYASSSTGASRADTAAMGLLFVSTFCSAIGSAHLIGLARIELLQGVLFFTTTFQLPLVAVGSFFSVDRYVFIIIQALSGFGVYVIAKFVVRKETKTWTPHSLDFFRAIPLALVVAAISLATGTPLFRQAAISSNKSAGFRSLIFAVGLILVGIAQTFGTIRASRPLTDSTVLQKSRSNSSLIGMAFAAGASFFLLYLLRNVLTSIMFESTTPDDWDTRETLLCVGFIPWVLLSWLVYAHLGQMKRTLKTALFLGCLLILILARLISNFLIFETLYTATGGIFVFVVLKSVRSGTDSRATFKLTS